MMEEKAWGKPFPAEGTSWAKVRSKWTIHRICLGIGRQTDLTRIGWKQEVYLINEETWNLFGRTQRASETKVRLEY